MKVDDKVIIAGIAIVAVLAILAVIGAACCACMLFFSTTSWHWGEWNSYSQEHRTDTTVHGGAANIELYVNTINGGITIQESAAVTNVTVTYDIFYPEGRINDMLTSTRSNVINNDTVRITAEAKRNPGYLPTGNYGADVTVLVPENSSYVLNLNTWNGRVTVAPLHGSSAILYSMNGDVILDGGSYDIVRMETLNGDVDASGPFEATNTTLITKNGRIEADTLQSTGTLYADTWNGRVDVTLPRDTLFSVDASTLNGRVRHGSLQFNATVDKNSQLKGYTTGGAGSLTVTLRTANGEINIGY